MTAYQGDEQRKDNIIICIINACKKQGLLYPCFEKKKIPWKKIFLPVYVLVHFMSRGLIPLFDLPLALKYFMGRQNISAAAFVLDSFLFAIIC